MKLLVTGGAGFIGSNFVRHALDLWPDANVTVLDALTYAGNPRNLDDVAGNSRFRFYHGDICDDRVVSECMNGCSHVVNFAAETHVDRSILNAREFVRTDVEGTGVLLQAACDLGVERYLQVSTDEVYGEIDPPSRAGEDAPLRPRSPYAASKSAGDLMVNAFHTTFGLPTLITRGANTYGPRQYPEKLVSLFITNALDGDPLPLYGDGLQVRDWLYVDDHCRAIAAVLESGVPGNTYNVGAGDERANLEVVDLIVDLTGCNPDLVRQVTDRPGHDRRYALDTTKITSLGWSPTISLKEGLSATVRWYQDHRDWWEPIKRGEFREYYRLQYAERIEATL